MRIHEVSQHNTKFWVFDEVHKNFSVDWFDQVRSTSANNAVNWNSGRQGVVRFSKLGMSMVLRHYCRGGVPARVTEDKFVFTGYLKSRSYRELMLLDFMCQQALPVPKPIAAKCQRNGMLYYADILMHEIANTQTLVERLVSAHLSDEVWQSIGNTISQFHAIGIDHVDLNANNILLNEQNKVFLIDFDRCCKKPYSKVWAQRGLQLLHRSLTKEKYTFPEMHYEPSNFEVLKNGYGL